MAKKPALRTDIQLVMTLNEGRRMIVFQDPYDLSDQHIAVEAATLPLLQMLDGRHELQDIQQELTQRSGGRLVYLSAIESFLESLDRAFLLNSESFRREMDSQLAVFSRRESRLCVHAGKSYDEDPEKLARFIEETESELPPLEHPLPEIRALIAPHIDIRVASHTYVNAYRRLKGRHYDLVVILGINHHSQDGLFCASTKNYHTPFGEFRTDRDFVEALQRSAPPGTFASNDFGHKIEHSIEFQTLFLHHYLKSPSIVPVLCGGIHEFLLAGQAPFEDSRFMEFIESMRKLTQKRGKVLFVAGVDFSHVGLKFGDGIPADALLARAQANDRIILDALLDGDGRAIYKNADETQDQYKVCGLPALILMAELMSRKKGTLLDYRTYREAATSSAVTYASAVFTD
ncbi:MAG TPA: AmmeMemoRadiSam system protein B [Syntrophales bacterium]|nr:AmmeMemoRadiSam system protein B [Syntrophales bacterium]